MSGRSRSLMPGDPKAGNSLRHKGMHVAIGPMRRAEIERVTGIEPAWPAWKAGALPLSYTRAGAHPSSGCTGVL
jgi:hypothetical protein